MGKGTVQSRFIMKKLENQQKELKTITMCRGSTFNRLLQSRNLIIYFDGVNPTSFLNVLIKWLLEQNPRIVLISVTE